MISEFLKNFSKLGTLDFYFYVELKFEVQDLRSECAIIYLFI